MDPLSHAALGRTIAALAGGDRARPGTVAAAVAGALAPDIDAVAMPLGWDRYLAVHEIGTHSVPGTAVCALLAAAIVKRFMPQTHWSPLVIAGWLGAASHVLLDLLSSARIRALWPVMDRQFSIPLVAMADPWLAAILIAALPILRATRRPRRQVAGVMLSAAAAFLAFKAVLAVQAVGAYASASGAGTDSRAFQVQATWAALRDWDVYERAGSELRVWRASAGKAPTLSLSWPLAPDTPNLARSRSLSVVRNFLRAHELVLAASVPRPDGGELVLWSDVRFCWNAGEDAAAAEPIVRSGASRLACGLWFGAEFDRDGTAVRQVVKIGAFTQTRAPG